MNRRALAIVGGALAVLVLQAQAYARTDKSASGEARLARSGAALPSSGSGAVIKVADPTGDPTKDRPNIEAALALTKPGDTVLFGKGTYVTFNDDPRPICVGEPNVTLLGNAEGTTLFGASEPTFDEGPDGIMFGGGGITVRRLTFESYAFTLILDGDCAGSPPPFGGFTIADNVFKNLLVPVTGAVNSSNPTSITHNQFIDTSDMFFVVGHVFSITGNTYRVLHPGRIPQVHKPFNAGGLFGADGLECNDNVIENNTVEGNVDGFQLFTIATPCRRNVIRNNSVSINEGLLQPGDGGTVVGLFGSPDAPLDNNLIEGNFLDGSKGTGIPAFWVRNSTFQGNVVRNVRRDPDLGPLGGGVAILLAGESRGNSVSSNQLRDNQFCDVWLRLHTRNNLVVEPNDAVLDRGTHNQVLSEESCGEDAAALRAELTDGPLPMPAKIKTLLEALERRR